MEIVTLITAVVSIITLIVFFTMASNISGIRSELQNKNYQDALIDYHTAAELGKDHYHDAGKALLRAYYSRMILAKSDWSKESMQRQLEDDLGDLFKAIQYEIPQLTKK
jgi:hypothetical protein